MFLKLEPDESGLMVFDVMKDVAHEVFFLSPQLHLIGWRDPAGPPPPRVGPDWLLTVGDRMAATSSPLLKS